MLILNLCPILGMSLPLGVCSIRGRNMTPPKKEKPVPYRYALVKFNGGLGALLCNGCLIIVAYGFDHKDKLHYCEGCDAYRDHQK